MCITSPYLLPVIHKVTLQFQRGVRTYFRSMCLPFLFNVFSCFRSVIHRVSCTQTNILRTKISIHFGSLWNSVLFQVLSCSYPVFTTFKVMPPKKTKTKPKTNEVLVVNKRLSRRKLKMKQTNSTMERIGSHLWHKHFLTATDDYI